MDVVVAKLDAIITKTNIIIKVSLPDSDVQYEQHDSSNIASPLITENSLQEGLSQVIQNLNTEDLKDTIKPKSREVIEKNLFKKDLNIAVNEIVDLIFKVTNEGKEWKKCKQCIFDYLNDQNITSQQIYNWLLNNQNNPNSMFLLGYFNYCGIEISKNHKETFDLFINASKQNHI